MIKDLLFAGGGFVIGAFTPAVGRQIKAFFTKESKAAIPSVKSVVATVEAEAKKL